MDSSVLKEELLFFLFWIACIIHKTFALGWFLKMLKACRLREFPSRNRNHQSFVKLVFSQLFLRRNEELVFSKLFCIEVKSWHSQNFYCSYFKCWYSQNFYCAKYEDWYSQNFSSLKFLHRIKKICGYSPKLNCHFLEKIWIP